MTALTFDIFYRDHGASRGMTDLGDRTEKTASRMRGLKVAGAVALAAVGGAAVKFGSSSVKAYVEAEQSQLRLQEAYRKFPKLADTQIGSLQKLNDQLAQKTRFDDDATASGQAVLAQFKLTGTEITQLTPLLQDYAAKTGKDLPTAARDLGKAVLGQGKSLKAVGINFKDTGSEAGNLEQITQGLRTQVGGFAEKEGKSAAGRAEILKNQFGELQEAAGQQLLPALLKVGGGLLKLVGFAQDVAPVFGAFKRVAVGALSGFSEAVGGGRLSFKNFADFILTHQGDIVGGFVKFSKGAIKFATVLAQSISTGLRGFGLFADGLGFLVSTSISGFGTIVSAAAGAFGWIPGIGPKLKAADSKFQAFAANAAGNITKTGDKARGLADAIDGKVIPALGAAGRGIDAVGRKEIDRAKNRDAARKLATAIEGIGTNADGSAVKLKTWADRTKLGAEKQADLRERLKETRTALIKKLGAMQDAGKGQDDMSRAVKKTRDRLYDEFRQMGLSKEEARKLSIQYTKVPSKVKTNVTQPGMSGARDDTRDLDRRINNLNGKNVSINYKTNAGRLAKAFKLGLTLNSGEQKGGSQRQVGGQAGRDPAVTLSHGHGPTSGGPTVSRSIKAPVHGRPNSPDFDTLTGRLSRGMGNKLGAGIGRKLDAAKAKQDAASSGPGGSVKAGPGWGPVYAAMRKRGARNFNTYPGHHPSAARARDVTPHNWAAANAARALSSVWYVIYKMRIASKNHGNGWRPYSPISRRGDWRHDHHIHVALRDKGGLIRPGQLAMNVRGGTERVLTDRQNRSFERMVRVADRGHGGGNVTYILNAPNYVGSHDDLRRALVDMDRRGQLTVLKRTA